MTKLILKRELDIKYNISSYANILKSVRIYRIQLCEGIKTCNMRIIEAFLNKALSNG